VRLRRGSNRYVRDRRGGRAGAAGGGLAVGGLGGVGVIVFLVVQLLSGGGGGGGVPGLDAITDGLSPAPAGSGADRPVDCAAGELEQFTCDVMDDLQLTWTELFADDGLTYEPTSLVLFADAVSTGGCGQASSAVGPFYCPADRLAYIDLGFYRDLRDRFGAPGDLAQAYVLAHENGHHVQNLLGVGGGGRQSNEESVRAELQADCYAGVWAHEVFEAGELEEGDVEEALDAAAAVGDDRLQPGSSSESWTHGSSAQRVRWFRTGFDGGDPDDCDTFAVADDQL